MESPHPPGATARPEIPDHELIRSIGVGSYGEVWLGRNLFGQYRAIKVVRRSAFDTARPFEREFNGVKEFEPVSRSHEAFVDILQVGQDDHGGYFYCVMELADDQIEGQHITPPLYSPKTVSSEIANRGHLPVDECISIGLNLADGLRALHESGLVHRDIKPSNIVFVNGVAKLADIGLVHSIAGAATFVGTLGYIPPEGPGSVQADIYSLGKVLYELSTGNDRQQFPELPDFILNSPESSRLTEFNNVLVRACENERERRYLTADELHSDLEVLKSGKSLRRLRTLERRWAIVTKVFTLAATALVICGTVGLVLFRQYDQAKQARAAQVLTSLNYGSRLMDEGNSFSALSWFVDALKAQGDGIDQTRTIRTTIASVFHHGPHLLNCWWHDAPVHHAEFSPDGKFIAFADHQGLVSAVDRATQKVTARIQHGKSCAALSVKFSTDGLKVVTTGSDWYARVWNFESGELLAEFPHSNHLHSAQFSGDGSQILTASGGGTLLLWNIATRTVLRSFRGHKDTVWNASFSPNGRQVISSGSDQLAIVWDVESGAMRFTLPHPAWVYDAVFSPDGKWIATVSFDQTLRIWDTEQGHPVLAPLQHDAPVNSVRFSPDGTYIVTTSFDFSVRVWDVLRGELAASVIRHSGNAEYATFSPDCRYLLTSSWDKTVRLWDVMPRTSTPVSETYSANGKRNFRVEGQRVLAFETGSTNSIVHYEAPYPIRKLVINRSGTRFLALPANPAIRKITGFDLSGKEPLHATLTLAPNECKWAIADAAPIAVLSFGSVAETWDLRRGVLLARWNCPGPPGKLIISKEGGMVALTIATNAHLVNTQTGRDLFRPLAHALPVSCGVFSRDGKRILTGCADQQLNEGYACVWDISTGEALTKRLSHGDGVIAVAFNPDETLAASGGEDFVARVWSLKTGQSLPPFRHKNPVRAVSFSDNGRWLITGSADSAARIWDVQTAAAVTPPLWHPTAVSAVSVVHDHSKLVTVVTGGRTRLWDLRPETNDIGALAVASRFLAGAASAEETSDRAAVLGVTKGYSHHADLPAAVWHENRAAYCEFKKQFFAAQFHLQQLLRLRGASDDLWGRLGRAQATIGDLRGALASYLHTPGVAVKHRARIGLLELAEGDNAFDETVGTLRADPDARIDCAWLLALAEPRPERVSETRSALERVSASEATDASLVLRAALHSALGEHDPALEILKDAKSDSITSAEMLGLSALVMNNGGKTNAARQRMAEALQISKLKSVPWEQRVRFELIQRRFTSAAELQHDDTSTTTSAPR